MNKNLVYFNPKRCTEYTIRGDVVYVRECNGGAWIESVLTPDEALFCIGHGLWVQVAAQ